MTAGDKTQAHTCTTGEYSFIFFQCTHGILVTLPHETHERPSSQTRLHKSVAKCSLTTRRDLRSTAGVSGNEPTNHKNVQPSLADTRDDCTRRSWPHALSFFSGHEGEGHFPVYELGCCGLLPFSHKGESNSGARPATAEPYPDLAPVDLMPGFTRQNTRDTVAGMICCVSVGYNVDSPRKKVNATRDDALSFVVNGAGGEEITSLRLVPAA